MAGISALLTMSNFHPDREGLLIFGGICKRDVLALTACPVHIQAATWSPYWHYVPQPGEHEGVIGSGRRSITTFWRRTTITTETRYFPAVAGRG